MNHHQPQPAPPSNSQSTTYLTITLTPRQTLDLALLLSYFLAIQLHSFLQWRRVYRVHRFSPRHQRLYVVFSLRKLLRLLKEVVLDHVVFVVCAVVWVGGVWRGEREEAAVGDGMGDGEWVLSRDGGF